MGFRLDGQTNYMLDEEEAAKEERLLRGFRSSEGDTEDSVELNLDEPREIKLLQNRGMRDPGADIPIESDIEIPDNIEIRDNMPPIPPPQPKPKVKQKSLLDKILEKYGVQ